MYDRDMKGNIAGKLKECTGKVLSYLGMVINFETKGEVTFDMTKYTKNMVQGLKDLVGKLKEVKTPTAEHLFHVRDSANKLSNDESMTFHNATAKALYPCKRSCPDLQTTVSFFTTQVKEPDEDDQKKLFRLMGYFKTTAELGLTLSNKGEGYKWWIDAAFEVHPNMCGHTQSILSMGKDSVFSKSTTQKINMTSSTEAEMVGIYEVMLEIVWINYFWRSRGIMDHGPLSTKTIFQLCCWRKMVPKAAQREPNISTLDTTLFLINGTMEK